MNGDELMSLGWSIVVMWGGAVVISALLGFVAYDIFEKENERNKKDDTQNNH